MFVIGLRVPLYAFLTHVQCCLSTFFCFFVPMHLVLIVAFFFISSCLSSISHESQENLFLRISAACGAVWMQSAC